MWSVGNDAKRPFSLLVKFAEARDSNIKFKAENALRNTGPGDVWAASTLAEVLKTGEAQTRIRAAEILGQIGPSAAPAARAALVQALQDSDEDVRLAVAKAIAKVDVKK